MKFSKRQFLDNGLTLTVIIVCRDTGEKYKETMFYDKGDRDNVLTILNCNVNLWKKVLVESSKLIK